MNKVKLLLSKSLRSQWYFAFSFATAFWSGARVGQISWSANHYSISFPLRLDLQFWYLILAIVFFVVTTFSLSIKESSKLFSVSKQIKYASHWTGIFFFNSLGLIFYPLDLVFACYILFFSLFLTSLLNSLPYFRDTLESKIQIFEKWRFEDFIFFRGHFSKNHPKASRNPVHAAWPILLFFSFCVTLHGLLETNRTKHPIVAIIKEVGRSPASIKSDDKAASNQSFQTLKGLIFLSIGSAGLFVIYNHSLRSDYAKKWEILNKHQYDLLKLYSNKEINLKEIELRESQFCIDLLETNMWGHRSFHPLFGSIISPLMTGYNKERVPRKILIDKLNAKILEAQRRETG